MTIMEKEIALKVKCIETIGYYVINGFFECDEITICNILTMLICEVDYLRESQEKTYNDVPWLRSKKNV